jgi:hypothetical protein
MDFDTNNAGAHPTHERATDARAFSTSRAAVEARARRAARRCGLLAIKSRRRVGTATTTAGSRSSSLTATSSWRASGASCRERM